jgi:hypothetical protein
MFEEYLMTQNLIPQFLATLTSETASFDCKHSVSSLLASLPQTMINLNMFPPFLEMMLQGSQEVRSSCADILLSIWDKDESLFTADQDLQTLELLGSFVSDAWRIDTSRYVECITYFVENITDTQLLIDSNILKSLLTLIDERDDVLQFYSQFFQRSITEQENSLLQYLVDDIGALTSLTNAIHEGAWVDGLEDYPNLISRFKDEAKEAIRAVMESDARYKEMVFEMEMPQSLKDELMRELKGNGKGKRKRQ